MDVSQITENLYIASKAIHQTDPDLITSMVFQRRPPKALTAEGLRGPSEL
jgi:hypothetical protein